MKRYYVYILHCADDTYYTGISNNIELRLSQHQNGTNKDSYTFSRRPVELKWFEEYGDVNLAISTEKKIKKWSKAKKLALINGQFEKLKGLSKKKF